MLLNNKHAKNPYKISISKYSTHNIIQNLIKIMPQGVNILDVGCNEGYIGKDLNRNFNFYGLDYMNEPLIECKKHYKDASIYDLNNLEKLKWNIKFDMIIFADVLEHVIDAKSVLNFFVQEYLKPNGQVIISVPNVANWQIRLNLLFGKFRYTETGILDKTHLHLYTFETAKELTKSTNLEEIKAFGGASILGPVISMFPFLMPIFSTNIILHDEKI